MHPALPREREAHGLLGARLADRAGDRDDRGIRAPARRAAEAAHGVQHVGHDDQPARVGRAPGGPGFRRRLRADAPLSRAAATKAWPSWTSPWIAKKRSPGRQGPGVDRRPVRPARRRARRAAPVAASISSRVQSGALMTRLSAMAARISSWSENGSVRSPTIWPVSWPLPATTRTSPGSSARDGRADGLGPVADLAGAGRRRQDLGADRGRIFAARIVVRDDHQVGLLDGDRAHDRALAPVAVAAAAEHARRAVRGVKGRRASSTCASASGLWA